MAGRVILAVAGAGKTYHICHSVDPRRSNLILAYTRENVYNIQRELRDAYGCIPELTTVSTFDSFVYHELVLPYEPSITKHFGQSGFAGRGISVADPPSRRVKVARGRYVTNPRYKSKDQFLHYITNGQQYYCATLSELVLQVKKGRESLVKRVAARINKFYDYVLIDEFQDFREHNYELIVKLAKQLNNVVLVGDYYQHSVSSTNNSGKPFKKRSANICYDDFVGELEHAGFEVDTTTLKKSRRCSPEVCGYISNKLGIRIESLGINRGSIIWVDNDARRILEDPSIVKLVYNNSSRYTFRAVNWSYSKGDTMNAVCVILTDDFEGLADGNFSASNISIITINKLYVAMTRSRGDLYLMKLSTFKKIHKSYLKH